jgi:hypothetical protein
LIHNGIVYCLLFFGFSAHSVEISNLDRKFTTKNANTQVKQEKSAILQEQRPSAGRNLMLVAIDKGMAFSPPIILFHYCP